MSQSTFIGLDVHARSVWAGVLDGASGEVAVGRGGGGMFLIPVSGCWG